MGITCHCGSNRDFEQCCQLFLSGRKKPTTPEQLMRSRYSAYVSINVPYLLATTHISTRKYYSQSSIKEWAEENTWLSLEIIAATGNTVHFKAHYKNAEQKVCVHEEFSTFIQENGKWFFVEGE